MCISNRIDAYEYLMFLDWIKWISMCRDSYLRSGMYINMNYYIGIFEKNQCKAVINASSCNLKLNRLGCLSI